MTDELKGKVAIVTGSGQGIGKALALALAQHGAAVVTNNRRRGSDGGDAETAAQEIARMGGQAVPFYGDAANFEVAGQLVQKAVAEFGRLDILVNNAGADAMHMIWNMTEAEWDLSINSYLKSTFNCCRFAAGSMRQQRSGRIINTTSVAWLGQPGHANYCAAKAGIVGLTRAVAQELGRYGVTCNAYAPTAATRFTTSAETRAGFKKRYEAGLISKERFEILMNLPGPEWLGAFVVYLCTDAAADINGRVFDVTGGDIAIYSEPAKQYSIQKKEAFWTVEELKDTVPGQLLKGYTNPAPEARP